MSLTGTPVIILKEGTQRTRGRDALHSNIQAAKVLSEAVKSSLGPRGMDKMLVNTIGDVMITNDGATILSEIDITHPGAKYIIDLARTQDQEVGDGTTSVVVLTGELLKYGEELVESGIHPSIIAEGYRVAKEEVIRLLDQRAKKFNDDRNLLLKIAGTSMGTKTVSGYKDELAQIVVDAVQRINDEGKIDIDNIMISKHIGQSLSQTELINGLVLKKERGLADMPSRIEQPTILLLNTPLEVKKTKFDSKLRVETIQQISQLKEHELNYHRDLAEKIVQTGAKAVISQKGIADPIETILAKNGILAIKNVPEKDLNRLAKATGAKIQLDFGDLGPADLGSAGLIEQIRVGGEEHIVIRDTQNSLVVTIILHGGSEFVLDEFERSIHDAICVVRNVIEDNKVVTGGGSVENFIANRLREFKLGQPAKLQSVIEAFARGIESIPVALSVNAGLDPIDMIGKLNQKYKENKYTWGIDAEKMDISDMSKLGVYDPYRVKSHSIISAAEAATFILRIDDVVASKGKTSSPSPDEDWD